MPGQAIYDKDDSNVHINVARLKKGGQVFEVVIDPDKAVEHKEGRPVDIKDVLKSENIFMDVKKGLLAPETVMKELFETSDTLKIADVIIRDGEIQLTAEHRKKVREQKYRQIVELIHRNGVDPKTHLPHPVTRIESAMEEAKVKIDEFKRPEDQVQKIVVQLRVVLPIKMEVAEVTIRIPNGQNAARCYPLLKSNCTIVKEDWLKDGSWQGIVELPAGLTEDFFAKLNKATKGDIETKILKTR
jgi:ribosome maturation protein SDO1